MAIYDINSRIFDNEVIDYKETVVVDFWAPWCAPCRVMADNIVRLDKEMEGSVKICKVNIDDDEKEKKPLADRFEVYSIPTLLVFKNGELKKRIVGLRTTAGIREMIMNL